MIINSLAGSVTYKIKDLAPAEEGLNEIEKTIRESEGVDEDLARSILSDLNAVRDSLYFKRGINRMPEKK